MKLEKRLENTFPGLKNSDWKITSPNDNSYNCISHAVNVIDVFWWPDPWGFGYWPDDQRGEPTTDRFITIFNGMGYAECNDSSYEKGLDKIALYCEGNLVNHAARQLSNGVWTSKLGRDVDIEHSLLSLEGKEYGKATIILKRSMKL